jgi:hypothetical protein
VVWIYVFGRMRIAVRKKRRESRGSNREEIDGSMKHLWSRPDKGEEDNSKGGTRKEGNNVSIFV